MGRATQLIAGRPEYRLVVGTGTLVADFRVIGQLASDGAIELVPLDIDLDADW